MIDRRPWWWIQMFGAERHRSPDNPGGQVPWWRRADYTVLRSELVRARDLGVRHVMLNRPMGTTGAGNVPGASWLTMTADQRAALAEAVREFPELVIVPFFGSTIRAADRLEGEFGGQDGWSPFWSPSNIDAFNAGQATMAGWDSIGVRTFALDHAAYSVKADHYASLAPALASHGVTILGEAIPHIGGEPRRELTAAMPWIATPPFMRSVMPVASFNPERERALLWMDWSPSSYGAERFALAHAWTNRGMGVISLDRVLIEQLMWRYERGRL